MLPLRRDIPDVATAVGKIMAAIALREFLVAIR